MILQGMWGPSLWCCVALALLVGCSGVYVKTRTFAVDGVAWEQWEDPATEETYYYNPSTQTSQWGSPRSKSEEKAGRRMMIVICLVPLMGLLSLCFGRIYYLRKNYPDLLNPTKVRKAKTAKRHRMKPMKTRFKISQDGKGGRSANS